MTLPRLTADVAVAVLALTVLSGEARAQLSLREAFAEADRAGFDNRIAAGDAATRRAQALLPLKGIAPSVHLDAGYARTTDPIGVFGGTLRQRAVTPANFDPARLNDPDALGNYQAAIVIEQPLWNADAWAGRRAGVRAATSSRETAEWTRLSTRVDVVRAYYGIVLANERVATLRTAAHAALAHVAEAEAMVREGVVTKSDALLAAVRAGDVDAQLAEAVGAASTTRRQLALLLGRGALDAGLRITATSMPSTERIRTEVMADTGTRATATRADVRAAADGVAAARADALRAKAVLLPRINGFARYDWNSPTSIYGGDRNWTVGVVASWLPFAGVGEIADVATAAGRVTAAAAQAEAARANAIADVDQTRTVLSVALVRLEIAERAAAQSVEAHRIVSRKYTGGLAGVVELLEAQAVETQSALALAQARYAVIVAAAERRRALGLDPASLAPLDDPNAH
jgi:outer membrane protein TolC